MSETLDVTVEEKLTPEQIANWRKAMFPMLGPYILICPDEDIQRLRDNMQRCADEDRGSYD